MASQVSSFIHSHTTAPTVEVPGFPYLLHFEPLAQDWQNDILRRYYSGEFENSQISESISGGRQRSITFQTAKDRETLYDHPTPNATCRHHLTRTFDIHETDLNNDGYEISTVCKSCSRVFRNYRFLGDLYKQSAAS